MPTVTMQELGQAAFQLLGVFSPAETMPAADGEYALTCANDLLDEWSNSKSFSPFRSRERFAMTAGKGSPGNPYTIGIGGDLNTDRPPNQDAILSANLILAGTDPEVNVPLAMYTDEAYAALQIPTMSNSQPTGLYYSPTYASGFGKIQLWPVPNTGINSLVLFLQKFVAQFADLDTEYEVPTGLPRALKYNLADTMSGTYGRELAPSDARIAVSSLDRFKRSNLHLTDLPNDATFTGPRPTLYNINSGNG